MKIEKYLFKNKTLFQIILLSVNVHYFRITLEISLVTKDKAMQSYLNAYVFICFL